MPRPPKKKPSVALTARSADRHALYQASVQEVEVERRFLDRVFARLHGRPPVTLREDFCGTALLCAEWVKHRGRRAVGLDLDRAVLAYGRAHNLLPLGARGASVKLLRRDVRSAVRGPFDVAVGLNFSYFVFKTRPDLLRYFRSVRRSLGRDGVFFVDAYGGWEAQKQMRERRRVRGFTYVWDQEEVDAIDRSVLNHIHFEFPDGTKIRRAFTYEWRLWTLPEIREVLHEAGFRSTTVYWEDADANGHGTSTFRPREHAAEEAAWVAYVVAAV